MDTNFIGQLLLSMTIFAPGLVMLAGLAFIGMLMLLEKTVLRGKPELTAAAKGLAAAQHQAACNPGPDRIVAGLKDAVAQQANPVEAEKPADLRTTKGGR